LKKIIFLLILLINISFADDIVGKLYEKIFTGIFPQKNSILVYNIGNKKYNSKKIVYTKEIYNSDIIFISEFYRLGIYSNKPIFASSLIELKLYENAIGALYWDKDEPKIIFLKDRLDKFNIKIANYLMDYIVDEKIHSF